jgi:hypothetical protein
LILSRSTWAEAALVGEADVVDESGSTPMMWQHTASKATWLLPMHDEARGKGMGVSMRPSPAVIASMAMSCGWMMYCRSAIFSLSRWSWSMSRCRSSWMPM